MKRNARLNSAEYAGELSRKEGGKIFGSGSRTPIAITILVKNPSVKTDKAAIHYHDIGDYLSREEKLAIVNKFNSIANPEMKWTNIQPNEHGDWLSQRNDIFGSFIQIGNKEDKLAKAFFNAVYSRGLATARDAWCYNSSKRILSSNIKSFIDFYNEQRETFHKKRKSKAVKMEDVLNFDSNKITWNRGLKQDLERNYKIVYESKNVNMGLYRPYFKQYVYFARELNDMTYQLGKHFPNSSAKNLVICVSAPGGSKNLSVLMSETIPDLHLNGDTQCFPLYYYEEQDKQSPTLWDTIGESDYIRRDGVSDFILGRAKKQYGKNVNYQQLENRQKNRQSAWPYTITLAELLVARC